MIITVEGPSAAGKTTWIYNHFDQSYINDELRIDDTPGNSANLEEIAQFWAGISRERWAAVCAQEAKLGLVVCDADPFKLHYVWSLWRLGKVDDERWQAEKSATRQLFANEELGLSDLVLINIPDQSVLESHAKNDQNRSRPSFALHAQLAEPLKDWYKAIELIDPSRVRWDFPDSDIEKLKEIEPRSVRSGVELFDLIMASLPVC